MCRGGIRAAPAAHRKDGDELVHEIIEVFFAKFFELGQNARDNQRTIAFKIVSATVKSNAFYNIHGNANGWKQAGWQTGFLKE